MAKIKWTTYLKAILFTVIFIFVAFNPKNLFDVILSDMLTSLFRTNVFGFLGKMISYIFHDKILLLIMGVLGVFLFYIKEYKKSIFILSTAFFGSIVALIFKYSLQRTRPFPDLFDGYSFPSGHSTVVALFFLSLLLVINNSKDKVLIVTKFALVLVPLSRVIIGAHYVTDVIAGLLLGSIVVDVLKIYHLKIYEFISNVTGITDEEK
ncbi:phosphatase PAP2 family protein [Gemelliphila palaticanis]|uniref:Phosphatase PAP2 family protein n=1 Tax=Gemelliphila palaticanis TaxID=81950 RepID=A0ABX2T3I7_9BACL|nr:phosphatase PAP2 family protein [Gemella palaticanis]MBF0715646.1 phosphatase PAP2 family protein [Gemella palaticanis]NYS47576.1 phosphatase PAP2 family protein [Gemella palaticanis]